MEKCMKKFLSVLLVLFVLTGSVFAYQNVYRLSSDEVQTFLLLRKVSASLTPDPTYPVSAEQLSNLVKSLDTSKFNDNFMKMYNDLIDELDHPQVIFQKDGAGIDQQVDIIGVQLYKVNDPDIYMPYKDRIPMANLETDLYFGKYFFGKFGLDPMKAYNKNQKDITTLKDIMNYSEGVPYIPVASIGYGNLNLTVGRERLGAGNGYTGNLILGENSVFDDFVKLSFINSFMTYDFTYKRFITEGSARGEMANITKNVYLHRFSVDLFDKVTLSFTEGALAAGNIATEAGSSSKGFDFDYLNPFMFMHNHFKFYWGTVNNFFAFEAAAKIPDSWMLTAQVFIDQIVFGAEDPKTYGEAAYMALVNMSKTMPLGSGVADVYFEGAYGNPYVYLKGGRGYAINNRSQYIGEEKYKAVDLVADYLLDMNEVPVVTDSQYLGYRYGGDIFTLAAGAKYYWGNFKFDANVQYIAKGNYGIRDNELRRAEGRESYCDDEFKEPNVIQHTLIAELGADCTIARGLEIVGKAGMLATINDKHEKKPLAFDYQYAFGVNVHVLDFFDIRKPL